MAKYFSVDWLTQNHHNATQKPHAEMDITLTCTVQSSPLSHGKGHQQAKSTPAKHSEHMEDVESCGPQDSTLCATSDLPNCASQMTDIRKYSTGCDSENDEGNQVMGDGGPPRRVRTKFTREQISKLEKIFLKQQYLNAGERQRTAQRLNLTETQVRTWFQNRRMKLKRGNPDYRAPRVIFQPVPPVQHQGISRYLSHATGTCQCFYLLSVPETVPHEHMFYHKRTYQPLFHF